MVPGQLKSQKWLRAFLTFSKKTGEIVAMHHNYSFKRLLIFTKLGGLQRPLCSPLNRHCISPNLCHTHRSTIIKLLRKQDWEVLLCASFPHSSKQKAIFSLYFFVSTSGLHQYLCYDQAITMMYWGHMINKMAVVYQGSFPVRSKKRVHRVSYCWYLNVIDV